MVTLAFLYLVATGRFKPQVERGVQQLVFVCFVRVSFTATGKSSYVVNELCRKVATL